MCLPIEFDGFTIRINSNCYHSLVPGLISICLETVWVPLIKLFYYVLILKTIDIYPFSIEG